MGNFKQLLKGISATHPENSTQLRLLGNDDALNEIERFFDANDFKKLVFLGAGAGALVFYDAENPDIVLRLAPDAPFCERAVIPYVLQPLFVKKDFEEIRRLKLEILPRLINLDSIQDEECDKLVRGFSQEAANSGVGLPRDLSWGDFGIFEYNDPKNRGQVKQVLMAADDSVFDVGNGNDPKCTADYPSLAIQQAKQQELWDTDERLQRLLPDGPGKLPDTRIVADISPDNILRGAV